MTDAMTTAQPAAMPDHTQWIGPPRPAPLAAWAALQAGVLIFAACGQAVWPRQPFPREAAALTELFAADVIAVAMLFPSPLSDTATTLAIAMLCWPFFQLAGLLGAVPERLVWMDSAGLSIWVVGAAAWARLLRSRAARLDAVCIATCWVVGGALAAYLHAEAPGAGGTAADAWLRFPWNALAVARDNEPTVGGVLGGLGLPLAAAIIMTLARRMFLRTSARRPTALV